jgi:hypothetical protein
MNDKTCKNGMENLNTWASAGQTFFLGSNFSLSTIIIPSYIYVDVVCANSNMATMN